MTAIERHPHAVMDMQSRRKKAKKIELVLGLCPLGGSMAMLEVGTGSGGIAHYFGTHPLLDCQVVSVDVVDTRAITDGFQFIEVDSVALPFDDESFDVVITNHVIEHVGDEAAQIEHLCEVRRVLKPGGLGYLAVPNRWMLVEPHYRLPFLSWLPRQWRSRYLYARRAVSFYDCEPLEQGRLERFLAASGLHFENSGISSAALMQEIEPGNRGLSFYNALPAWIKRSLLPLMPTLIYRLKR